MLKCSWSDWCSVSIDSIWAIGGVNWQVLQSLWIFGASDHRHHMARGGMDQLCQPPGDRLGSRKYWWSLQNTPNVFSCNYACVWCPNGSNNFGLGGISQSMVDIWCLLMLVMQYTSYWCFQDKWELVKKQGQIITLVIFRSGSRSSRKMPYFPTWNSKLDDRSKLFLK
jgi:hypothetical protein